jgi:hypothetical protein
VEYVNRERTPTMQEEKAIHRDACKLHQATRWNSGLNLTLHAFYLLTVSFASEVSGRVSTIIGASGLLHELFRAGAPFALFVMCFVMSRAVLRRPRFAPRVHPATRSYAETQRPSLDGNDPFQSLS